MSRFSAICEWEFALPYLDGSCYYISMDGKIHIMMIRPNRVESISTLVHEINECEITNLFRTKLLKEIGGDSHKVYLHITRKLIKKYSWLFTTKSKSTEVSHIVAPYGVKNCCMPRKSYRLQMK